MAKISKTVPQKEKVSSSSISQSAGNKAMSLHEIIPTTCVLKKDFDVENPPTVPGRCEHASRYICTINEKHLEVLRKECGWGDEVTKQIPAPNESITCGGFFKCLHLPLVTPPFCLHPVEGSVNGSFFQLKVSIETGLFIY